MKNKPHRHKQTNTFKFQGFKEKVQGLKVNARKFLLSRTLSPDETDTFLNATLIKWRDLNLTEQFKDFQNDLGPAIHSLAQLLHNEDHILSTFIKHLQIPASAALPPILDMLAALAADIPQDFYQSFFYKLYPHLIFHLKTRDHEQIENVFLCFMSLFIILHRYLKDDIVTLYHEYDYASLLSKNYPWYVNELAAQTLAFLVRKLTKKKDFLHMAMQKLKRDTSQVEGVGRLLGMLMKSDVVHRLHSSASQSLGIIIDFLGDSDLPQDLVFQSASYSLTAVVQHVTGKASSGQTDWRNAWKDDAPLIWSVLWPRAELLLSNAHTTSDADLYLQRLLQLIEVIVSHKKAVLITDIPVTVAHLLAVVKAPLSDTNGHTVCSILSIIITSSHEIPSLLMEQITKEVFSSSYDHSVAYGFISNVMDFRRFESEVLPKALKFFTQLIATSDDTKIYKDILSVLAAIVLQKQPLVRIGAESRQWSRYPMDLTLASRACANVDKGVVKIIETILNEGLDDSMSNLEDLLICLICLPHIQPIEYQDMTPALSWILSDALERFDGVTEKIMSEEELLDIAKKSKLPKKLYLETPEINMNIRLSTDLQGRKLLYLISSVVETMSHILEGQDFVASLSQLELLRFITAKPQYRECVHFLRALDIFLTVAADEKSDIICEEQLEKLYPILSPALASSCHQVRLLVTHIFSLFPVKLPPPPENADSVESIFEVMFKVEQVAVTPWHYRERLRYLSMLDAEHFSPHQPISGKFDQAPLLFLIGQLYINFKELWWPVTKNITSHAHYLTSELFWPIWVSRLHLASHATRKELGEELQEQETDVDMMSPLLNDAHQYLISHPGFSKVPNHVDHTNFRDLLWHAMQSFPDVCEPKNKDIVPLFLAFLEHEYFPVDITVAPSQDISHGNSVVVEEGVELELTKEEIGEVSARGKLLETEIDELRHEEGEELIKEDVGEISKKGKQETDVDGLKHKEGQLIREEAGEVGEEESLVEMELDDVKENTVAEDRNETEQSENEREEKDNIGHQEADAEAEVSQDKMSRRLRASTKSLCEYLTFFSKMHNPRVLTSTEHLEELYMEFLTHPSPKVQKLSLDCIMTYGHKHLSPYKESLYRILDDKTFKTEITLFTIDSSNADTKLQEKHRVPFMSVLLRILYGKMQHKTGPNTAGKGKTNARRAVVLRFLAGAHESELDTFLDLAFDVFLKHVNCSPLDVVLQVKEKLDPKHVVPLNRMQGALSTLDNIFSQIGNLLTVKVSYLLKVLLFVLTTTTELLERRAEIRETCISNLKKLRQLAMLKLLAFFQNFESYAWTEEEVEAVFLAGIWPTLARLPDEGIYSPTALLKVFGCWAQNPRYFPLLAKCSSDQSSLTPLPYIVKLLNHEKCSSLVSSYIFGMIETLVTLEDYNPETSNTNERLAEGEEAEQRAPPIMCEPIVKVHKQTGRDGVSMQNFGTALIAPHLNGLLSSMAKMVSEIGKGRDMSGRDLTILTCLAEWVTCSDVSDQLLSIIVPLLINKSIKADTKQTQLLNTCVHLLYALKDSTKYLRPLLSLFSQVKGRLAREALCKAITVIAENHPCYQELAAAVGELNSWNLKMVDEPDYELRLERFHKIIKYLDNCTSIDIDMCFFLIHNSAFVITHIEDSALIDTAAHCMLQLIALCTRLRTTHCEDFTVVIEKTLLPILKSGVRHTNEKVRHEFISILGGAIRKCGAYVARLRDLEKLCDEKDDDSDFFCNMAHIQRHRRARAIARLAEQIRTGTYTFSSGTYTEFLIPLVSVFLFKEAYAKDDFILTSSVNCIGAIAHHLPWYSYYTMLRYYLKLLERDVDQLKLAVRVLEAVLDAFHEDLSKVQLQETTAIMPDDDTKESKLDEKQENTEITVEEEEPMGMSKPQRIYSTIVNWILPQMHKTLTSKTKSDSEHKVNKSKYPEDEDIKRIPLAYATVKLLRKLPKEALDNNINNIFMKIITFLKSRANSIRAEAREMLTKIIREVGPSYISQMVHDMKVLLTRGFQAHVLIYTLHSLLNEVKDILSVGDLDSCMGVIMDVCKEDLFGHQAEEKEVGQITGKVKEARGHKSFAILVTLSSYISTKNLNAMVVPLKDTIASTQDKKIVRKVSRCLNEVATGLNKNEGITTQQKLIFIFGILTERIPELSAKKTEGNPVKKISHLERPDSFIIQPEPRKMGHHPKTSLRTTGHVFIEFALQLLYNLMRNEKFSSKSPEDLGLLDPFVNLMNPCLNSEYPEVSAKALHCIDWLIKFPLPSLEENMRKICGQIFVLLNKFAAPGLAKGKVFDLVQMAFKSVAQIIKSVKVYTLEEEHLRVLLHYSNTNLDDYSQQHTTFTVLQAVVWRKLDAPELHKLMDRIKEMSITATNSHVLDQARRTFYNYFISYPKKPKHINAAILYFLSNVSYDCLEGRLSATIMMNEIISNFPAKKFDKTLEASIWFKLSEQLVKEESKENLELLQKGLKTLFSRSRRKEYLLQLAMKLLESDEAKTKGENAVVCYMGASSLAAFLLAPKDTLPAKLILTTLLPKICLLLHPDIYQCSNPVGDSFEDVTLNAELREIDNSLVALLDVFSKLTSLFLDNPEWEKNVDPEIWTHMQSYLLYPHLDIRLSSVGIIGRLLAAHPIDGGKWPCIADTTEKARSLALDLCDQLNTEAPIGAVQLTQLSLSVIRNLIYLVRLSHQVPLTLSSKKIRLSGVADETEQKELEGETDCKMEGDREGLSDDVRGALWVLRHIGNLAYEELKVQGREGATLRREALLNLIAGVAVGLGKEKLSSPSLMRYLLRHIARELTDEHLPEVLKTRTQEVASLLKDMLGTEKYTKEYSSASLSLGKKRSERRAQEKEMLIKKPQVAMKRKLKKHEAKKESKRRKVAERKGKLGKKKLKDHVIVS
ncbi:small subunit processome component 20 homolog [Oratosquilla oratoria]|uniref:small subunit processome component 20 homolog n=1 Tax=Oratosquilla oratoria TaxID=337810 RepID=UPI003F75C4D3